MDNVRLAWIATHPIQYQVPLLQAIARSPGIDLTVLFFSNFSTRNYVDKEFGRAVEWDVPMLEGYRHEFLPGTGEAMESIGFLRPRVAGLAERLTRSNFDAVLVQGWNHYGYVEAVWRAHREGLKVLLRCEATDHVAGAAGIKRALREAMVKCMLSRVDGCLAIGARNREFYRARGVDEARIGFMPYCVDNEYFRARAENADKKALRAKLNIEDKPVILYASKLTARKHADLLLEAYLLLPEPRPYLVYVGDGEIRSRLEQRVAENALRDVRMLGFQNQSELPGFYALADIFVLPSVNETWGLVINEAMNAGCAIVATNQVGSAADLVKNGENGFVVQPGDLMVLAQALAEMLKDNRYRAMGEKSREIIAAWGIPENVIGLRKALALESVA